MEAYIDELARAFDRAVQIKRTPLPIGDFKVHAHLRPYFVDGSLDMVTEGFHREAIPWILAFLWVANQTIQCDGTEAEKPVFQAHIDKLLVDLELTTPLQWELRLDHARWLLDTLFKYADTIIAQNPDIFE